MDSTLTAGIIGGAATMIAAFLGQKGILDKFLPGSKAIRLPHKWKSTWVDVDDESNEEFSESLFITRQKGAKISGYITMEKEPDKKWDFEGTFNGRFLQLSYFPSKDAENKLFLDYGCYFFELIGDGIFDGYSIGYYWNSSKITASKHQMKSIK
jgi:hypothetical protein